MKTSNHPLRLLALAALLAAPAHAAITVYTDESAFLSALSSSTVVDFNAMPAGAVQAPQLVDGPTFDLNISIFDEFWTPLNGNALYTHPINGSTALGALSSFDHVEFTFGSGNVNAFGGNLFGVDFKGDLAPGATIEIAINDNGDFVDDLTYSLSNPTATGFIGFITDQPNFTWIDLSSSFTAYSTFDNLILGSTVAVPEPSVALLLPALALGALRRRRR